MCVCAECGKKISEEEWIVNWTSCSDCFNKHYEEYLMNQKGIPGFIETLDKIKELHIKKNEDYATRNNPFSNFEFTEFVLRNFILDRDKSFVWPIATKLARLATLLNSNREPNNESIGDSFDDIICYTLLWKLDVIRRNKPLVLNPGDILNKENK